MSGGKTCRYYLQGNCKFGSSCRYSHSDGGGHRDYHDEYQPKHNKNAGQQFYGDTNWNYKHSEKEDYRNSSRYEKHNYNYDSRNNNEYEQNNPHYNYYDNRSNNQYEQNNHQYDKSNNQHVKKNYNRRNNHYEEQNNFNKGNYYEEENNYNDNYNNYNNDNKHKNNYQSPKNYYANNSIENNGKNTDSQNYNKHFKNKNEDYDKQPNYVNDIESFKNDYKNQTTSNRSKNYSNDGYDNKTEQNDASKKEKMKKLYKNEIKIYQMQMKLMLENNYWPFTCYNPIGQSPIVEPVGSLNLMEASFEEIRCDYYNVKNICASPEMIHKQVYDELLLKAKKQKEDIVNLKDFVLNDLIATFQKWEEAKLNPTIKNAIPVDENIYWDMSFKRLKTPSDNKTLLDSFSFVLSDEVTNTNDTGPKILMQTEVYGRMENGFDEEDFTDYVPIIPPPQKHCL